MTRATLVVMVLCGRALAQPVVTAPAPIVGDGRSVAALAIEPPPPAETKVKQLPVAEVATLACSGATVLAAATKLPPSVLAPAVTQEKTIDCTASLRGDAKFKVTVKPPGPGLYASIEGTDLRTTAKRVALEAFTWDGKLRSAPNGLRAAASDGKVTANGSKLELDISGNAPRLVAIALAEGDRLGAVFVPVTGVTTIPIESEPGASVQCWIAGRWFGPVATRGKTANVPIEVPPGVTHGVARSTGKAGYVTDAITDLKIPARSRIAALASSTEIHIGEPHTIAIAIAGNAGRPGEADLKVVATAKRGTIGAIKSLGGGLWSAAYTAPKAPGADSVVIKVGGDDKAGSATVAIDVLPGGAAKIELALPAGPFAPGDEITGTARVLDDAGNPLKTPKVVALLGGAALTVEPGNPATFRGKIPEKLPDTNELALEVTAGRAKAQQAVRAGAPPDSAAVRPIVDGRRATAELAVRDKLGNPVLDGTFEVQVTGAKLEKLSRDRGKYRAAIVADKGTTTARVVVRASGRVLADEQVRFDPPTSAIVLGAFASGGWVDNLGVLASPRGNAGLGIRRGVGGVELAALAGVELMKFSDSTPLDLDGMTGKATRSVSGIGVPITLRARFRLTRRFGLAIGGGIVPSRVHVKFDSTDAMGAPVQQDDYVESVIGMRAQLHGDVRLGPGRFFVGGSFGRGALADGVVVGQIEGLGIVGGYEWWFADFGW